MIEKDKDYEKQRTRAHKVCRRCPGREVPLDNPVFPSARLGSTVRKRKWEETERKRRGREEGEGGKGKWRGREIGKWREGGKRKWRGRGRKGKVERDEGG